MITLSGLAGWQVVKRKQFYYWIHYEKEYLTPRRTSLSELLKYKPDLKDPSIVSVLRIRFHHLKDENFTKITLRFEQ